MADFTGHSEVDEGGLWEVGVMLPVVNPAMERFEKHFTLYDDVAVGDNVIYVNGLGDEVKAKSFLVIGPSSDPTRDGSGNFLYYKSYEVFVIQSVYKNVYYNGVYVDKLYLQAYDTDFNSTTNLAYLRGDPITIKGIAESWQFLKDFDFSDIDGMVDPSNNFDFRYQRHDTLDDFKGFSQGIVSMKFPLSVYDAGIIQRFKGKRGAALGRIGNKKVRYSSWIRVGMNQQDFIVADDIDENTSGQVESNPIDEGLGYKNPVLYVENSIDEMSQINTSYMTPYLRLAFCSDTATLTTISDNSVSPGEISLGTYNLFLSEVVSVPEKTLSAKLAVYARYNSNPRIYDLRFLIDDVIVEHCVGTSKEDAGYYQMNMNPRINLNIANRTSIKRNKNITGTRWRTANADPGTRLKFRASWTNRPGTFIDDMRVLESWNREGCPIILRSKMPSTIPVVLICNMKVSAPKYRAGSPGVERADISIDFEEIAA